MQISKKLRQEILDVQAMHSAWIQSIRDHAEAEAEAAAEDLLRIEAESLEERIKREGEAFIKLMQEKREIRADYMKSSVIDQTLKLIQVERAEFEAMDLARESREAYAEDSRSIVNALQKVLNDAVNNQIADRLEYFKNLDIWPDIQTYYSKYGGK